MTSSNQTVQFVSLISRNDSPLYIQAFDKDSDPNDFLKFNFLSHMALDIFSSPTSLSLREQQQRDDKTGVILLFIQDEVTVYGYESSNGLKIVVGLGIGSDDTPQADKADVKDLFNSVHKCYLRTIFNPFSGTDIDDESVLQSATFDKRISDIVNTWNKS